MRVFEIWGNYGLGVHPVSKELKDLDAPDLPFCYSDMDSLCDQIEKQLSLTFEKAREIRERNHDFCMQNHTYVHRVQTILTTLQEKNWI
jgi:spore maturation protein CgeB